MDQPYSPFADWLSKFHTSSEPIQALWIVALAAVAVSFVWSLTASLRLWLVRRHRAEPLGELIYGVYRDGEGRWVVYAVEEARALNEESVRRLERPGLAFAPTE